MSKFDFLIGQKENLLTAIDIITPSNPVKPNQKRCIVKCKCDCGNITYLYPYQFKSMSIKSCGCLKHATPYNATHKLSKENIYHIWETIRLKCTSHKNQKYYLYGARGIKICDEWFNDYISFRNWSLANGYKKGLTIDRINNNGNYEPSNCRWTTHKIQQNNTRRNIYITYNNKTQTLKQWCEELNLNYKTINNRIKLGWDKIIALTTPIRNKS